MNFDRTANDSIRKAAELSLHALHVLHGRPSVGFVSTDARYPQICRIPPPSGGDREDWNRGWTRMYADYLSLDSSTMNLPKTLKRITKARKFENTKEASFGFRVFVIS